MIKWFKKIVRAILNLLPVLSILFIVNGNSSALKYDYQGIPWTNSVLPAPYCYSVNSDGKYYFDNTASDCRDGSTVFNPSSFSISFNGDAYDSDFLDDISTKSSQSILNFYSDGRFYGVYPLYTRGYSNNEQRFYSLYPLQNFYDVDHVWSPSYLSHLNLRFNKKFGVDGYPNFLLDSINSTALLYCKSIGSSSSGTSYWNGANGAVCPGYWNTREYVSSQILDYPYSSDGFYRYSSAVAIDGTTYTNTFSFTDLFDRPITKFSRLTIPLSDMDSGYFYDYRNVYSGRQFKFEGSFQFDGSFSWHSNIDTTGTFAIFIDGISRDTGQIVSERHDCTTNLVTVTGYKLLQYTCDFTLSYNYVFANPSLVIANNLNNSVGGTNNNNNYVWLTDSDWRFYTSYIVTDNDDTPGGAFNSTLTGGGSIPGDAQNLIPSGSSVDDFFASLANLFNFNLINPFAGIFNLFTDNSSCASIPTIAGMLNSSETQVCPWFDSTTRNVVTPVLGLASMMLLVGFVVRWLGSSSGNMFEDQTSHKWGNTQIKSKGVK